jgi:hypothetical protein
LRIISIISRVLVISAGGLDSALSFGYDDVNGGK